MARKREMPPELMAKFFQGVQEDPDQNADEWKSEVELRPPKVGLGYKVQYTKKGNSTKQEQRIKGMIRKDQKIAERGGDESSSSDEGESSRAALGSKKKK